MLLIWGHPVVRIEHGYAPVVGHHHSLEAPFFPKNMREQFFEEAHGTPSQS